LITPRKRQRGFGIAAAIFILLVLAVLGAFIVSVSTTQHAGAALDVQGTDAYRAARSGIEWGVFRAITVPSCVSGNGTELGTLSGMQVTVVCDQVPPAQTDEVKPGGGTVELFTITATACNLPNAAAPRCPGTNNITNPNYVERRITVMVEK
jgi:MSHA biogenesis protein MshP